MDPTVVVLAVGVALVAVAAGVATVTTVRRRRSTRRRQARRAWSISTAAAGAGVHSVEPVAPEDPAQPQEPVAPEDPVAPDRPRPADPRPLRRRADSLAPLDVVVFEGRTQTVESVRHRLGGVDLTFTDGRTASLRPFDTLPGPPPRPEDAP